MHINTPGVKVGVSTGGYGGVNAGISSPGIGINAGISSPGIGINAGISTPGMGVGISTGGYGHGGIGVSAGIGGIGVGVKVPMIASPMLVIMPNGKINTKAYRCNAITVIVFSCLAPWGCLAFVSSNATTAAALVIVSIIVQVGLIVACCLALHMPGNKHGWNGRRLFILIMCCVGSAFYIASIVIYITILIYVKTVFSVASSSSGAAGAVVNTMGDIIFYIVLVLFLIDFAFKSPLIINAMLLGTKVFKIYK